MNADEALQVLRHNISPACFSREAHFATLNDVAEITPEILVGMQLDEVAALKRSESLKNGFLNVIWQ